MGQGCVSPDAYRKGRALSPICAANNRRTVEPSEGGTDTMTSGADPAAVVVDVDHAAGLFDAIEGVGRTGRRDVMA
jgi:hypothetical protein